MTFKAVTEVYEKKGVFFQLPIRKRNYDFYSQGFCVPWYSVFLNPITYFKAKKFYREVDNAAGWSLWCFAPPIYFSRPERSLNISDIVGEVSLFFHKDKVITSKDVTHISSWGYEDYFNDVGGGCFKEVTKIYFLYKGVRKCYTKVIKGRYKYTYEHVWKDILSGETSFL